MFIETYHIKYFRGHNGISQFIVDLLIDSVLAFIFQSTGIVYEDQADWSPSWEPVYFSSPEYHLWKSQRKCLRYYKRRRGICLSVTGSQSPLMLLMSLRMMCVMSWMSFWYPPSFEFRHTSILINSIWSRKKINTIYVNKNDELVCATLITTCLRYWKHMLWRVGLVPLTRSRPAPLSRLLVVGESASCFWLDPKADNPKTENGGVFELR